PRAFAAALSQWVQALADAVGTGQIASDGQTLRRSGSPLRGLGPLHLVSAGVTKNHPALGRVAVEGKSNEVPAIPRLLGLLDLHGALVTIDALGCQKAIAQQILDQGGDDVPTVKDNQEHLPDDIQEAVARAFDHNFAGLKHDTSEARERGHGREEYRC